MNNIKVQELSYDPMFVQALEDFRLKRKLGLIKASYEGELAKKQYGKMYYEIMDDDRKAEKSDKDDRQIAMKNDSLQILNKVEWSPAGIN